jgi:hypothetical protein
MFPGHLGHFTRALGNAACVPLQDIGAALLMQRVAPKLPIHASTQMSITSGEGAEFARQLGAARVVVGRELTVREIERLGSQTHAEVCVTQAAPAWLGTCLRTTVAVHGSSSVAYEATGRSSRQPGRRIPSSLKHRPTCHQGCFWMHTMCWTMICETQYALHCVMLTLSAGSGVNLHSLPESWNSPDRLLE